MAKKSISGCNYSLVRPTELLPITRHLSYPLTLILLKLPVSPNQVTALSLTFGLIGAMFFCIGTRYASILGGVLLIICYTLDNCDGEIARQKKLSSEWGAQFDDFSDWLVDGAFFTSLGYGVYTATSDLIWFWFGLAATVGATIDYLIDLGFHSKTNQNPVSQNREQLAMGKRKPEDFTDWMIYIFHKLSRADFCIIVFGLAMFNLTWVLLPLGAIGAQLYWITDLFQRSRGWHT
ncbi:MAG: CDP-alcohol phosphatidyltransferase family protein [Pseudomonadota bacterium]|nr:CDP-alcohol phosphatidyltransferase family protein [Pseudomonadota bacterium]